MRLFFVLLAFAILGFAPMADDPEGGDGIGLEGGSPKAPIQMRCPTCPPPPCCGDGG